MPDKEPPKPADKPAPGPEQPPLKQPEVQFSINSYKPGGKQPAKDSRRG